MPLIARTLLVAALLALPAVTSLRAQEAASPWHRFLSSTKVLFHPASWRTPKLTAPASGDRGAQRAPSPASRKSQPTARNISEFMAQERP